MKRNYYLLTKNFSDSKSIFNAISNEIATGIFLIIYIIEVRKRQSEACVLQ